MSAKLDPVRRQAAPVDSVPKAPLLLMLGLQHVLVMYIGAVAVPMIIASALKLPKESVAVLINADLFTCGIATILQSGGIWRFEVRMPVMQGVAFSAVPPILVIATAPGLGLTAVIGAVIAGGVITMLLSPVFGRLVRLFPPIVGGSIVMVVGLSLFPVGVNWIGGGKGSADFGAPQNLALAAFVFVTTMGLVIATGDVVDKQLTATEMTNGLRANGLASLIGGIFNGFPYTIYSQNIGLLVVTGVKSRWVAVAAGVILCLLRLLPKLATIVASVPLPALGGAALFMFGVVTSTGVKTLARVDFETSRRNLYIVAATLAVSLLPTFSRALFRPPRKGFFRAVAASCGRPPNTESCVPSGEIRCIGTAPTPRIGIRIAWPVDVHTAPG